MQSINPSELPQLSFTTNQSSQKTRASSNKIGWLHAKSDAPGAKYNIEIKDALGRTLIRKMECGNDTDQYGEMVNLPIGLGEELEVVVTDIKGAEKVDVFIN